MNEKKNACLAQAKAIFRELGLETHDTLSRCCKATLHGSVCVHCGKPVQMPYYFITRHAVVDPGFFQSTEAKIRDGIHTGYEAMLVIP